MASQHIEVTGNSTRLNSEFRQFINQIQRLQDNANRLDRIFSQITTGDDWEAFRVALGLETVQDAQDLHAIFSPIISGLNSAAVNTFLGRLG